MAVLRCHPTQFLASDGPLTLAPGGLAAREGRIRCLHLLLQLIDPLQVRICGAGGPVGQCRRQILRRRAIRTTGHVLLGLGDVLVRLPEAQPRDTGEASRRGPQPNQGPHNPPGRTWEVIYPSGESRAGPAPPGYSGASGIRRIVDRPRRLVRCETRLFGVRGGRPMERSGGEALAAQLVAEGVPGVQLDHALDGLYREREHIRFYGPRIAVGHLHGRRGSPAGPAWPWWCPAPAC